MRTLSLHTSGLQTGEVHVYLGGELDMSSALPLEERLRDIEGSEPDVLVLDLSELKFLDSTGLRLIVAAHTRAQRAGRRLAIVQGTRAVKRIFRLTGVDGWLDIIDASAAEPAGTSPAPKSG